MIVLVHIFGSLLVIAGLVLMIKPGVIFHFLGKNSDNIWLYTGAISARAVLGALLIVVAGSSRYPLTLSIIGWIAIIAAVVLAVIGWNRFKRLLKWASSIEKSFGRAGGVLSVCLGVFLIYAFI